MTLVTQAVPMPPKLTIEKFLKCVKASGLVTEDQLVDAVKKLKAQGAAINDSEVVANYLVEQEWITEWQASRMLDGKHRGFTLGKYRLLSRLGAGAMGSVYLAEHNVMLRRCAVKVLPSSRVKNASFLQRFQLEAQAAAALSHPHIVRAYDVDHEVDGDREIHFLAMEFVDGLDLQKHVREKGRLDYVSAADIIRQAAEGLAHAEQAGLVHRDIKPANLLIDKQGVVKILDLGLAKVYDEKESISLAHNETLLGTADYISPEQALDSHDTDHRSDIYSLGCTFYCLLTGHPPFHEGTMPQRLTSHQMKPPPPIEDERDDLPKELAAIVYKMLAKERADRQQSAKDVAESLSVWLIEHVSDEWKKEYRERVADGMQSPLRGVDTGSSSSDSTLGNLSEPAIGIDLGTTFSVIARLDAQGTPLTIPNREGEPITPSVVFFDETEPIVGKEAVRAAEHEPDRCAMYAKRDVGEAEFHKSICGSKIPPEVIESLVLRKLRQDAQQAAGKFSKAVVTVPAYFNEPRRKATQDAARLAGIKLLDIINEPTAAAIAYGLKQGFVTTEGSSKEREVVLVYDLGGGTFDVTLMEIDGTRYQALATAGDVYLGGVDWDQRIVQYIADQFKNEHGTEILSDPEAVERLTPIAAEAKKALSTRDSVSFHFAHEKQKIRGRLDRATFESISSDLLDRTRMTVNKMLREAKLTWQDVTRLLLVGGSTRMPMVQRMLEKESGLKVDRTLSPDEAVAHGAAIYAGILLKKGIPAIEGISVANVNSHDLGILGIEPATKRTRRHIMIPRNTTLPASKSCTFPTTKQGQKSVLVNVVEGGTDSGANATPIGKCVVTDLPPDLPAKSPVKVRFNYAANGRLVVQAELPSIQKKAALTIERVSGLSDESLKDWFLRIQDGNLVDTSAAVDEILELDSLEIVEPIDDDDVEELLMADDDDDDLTLAEDT